MLDTLKRALFGVRSERSSDHPGQLALGYEDVSKAPVEPEREEVEPPSRGFHDYPPALAPACPRIADSPARQDMAADAAQLLAGMGWLPTMLRVPRATYPVDSGDAQAVRSQAMPMAADWYQPVMRLTVLVRDSHLTRPVTPCAGAATRTWRHDMGTMLMITLAANTEMMNLHLAEISTQITPGAYAVLVCDGAGWHQRGKQLQIPANITLLSLPTVLS